MEINAQMSWSLVSPISADFFRCWNFLFIFVNSSVLLIDTGKLLGRKVFRGNVFKLTHKLSCKPSFQLMEENQSWLKNKESGNLNCFFKIWAKEVSLEFFKLYATSLCWSSSLTCVTDVVQETFPPEENDQKKLHWEKRRCIGVSTSSQSQGCYLRLFLLCADR